MGYGAEKWLSGWHICLVAPGSLVEIQDTTCMEFPCSSCAWVGVLLHPKAVQCRSKNPNCRPWQHIVKWLIWLWYKGDPGSRRKMNRDMRGGSGGIY